MSLTTHQARIAARISAHPDLAGVTVISEADVPNLSDAVRTSLSRLKQCIVVASGGGEAVAQNAMVVTLAERFVVTIAQIGSLSTPVLSPIQIVERLLPWLHGYPSAESRGAVTYQIRSHAPLETDEASGHQITLEVAEPVRWAG